MMRISRKLKFAGKLFSPHISSDNFFISGMPGCVEHLCVHTALNGELGADLHSVE
jgi:hypothetical protein